MGDAGNGHHPLEVLLHATILRGAVCERQHQLDAPVPALLQQPVQGLEDTLVATAAVVGPWVIFMYVCMHVASRWPLVERHLYMCGAQVGP